MFLKEFTLREKRVIRLFFKTDSYHFDTTCPVFLTSRAISFEVESRYHIILIQPGRALTPCRYFNSILYFYFIRRMWFTKSNRDYMGDEWNGMVR